MDDLKHMKQAITKQLLSGMFLCGFLSFALPAANLVPFTDITPKQAADMIAAKSADPLFIILDVRRAKEFTAKHIKGALNIGVKASDFKKKIAKMDRNGVYLVYCSNGIRSTKAMNLMKELGFKKVFNLAGGLKKWRAEKLPLELAPEIKS